MYKRLRLTALIVLIAFISLPLVSLAHLGPGPHPHTHCSDCGAEAHMNPADCISYAHASDCQCAECVAKSESSDGFFSRMWDRYIRPGLEEFPGGTTFLNMLEDGIFYHESYPVWGITGGHGH